VTDPHPRLADLADRLAAAAGEGLRLYAVLDGARDPLIQPEAAAAEDKAASLYQGVLRPDLEAASPWLVDLGQGGSLFLEWLLSMGWGQSWGVFLVTDATFKQVRKHLRTLMMVKTEAGQQLYFRFYDPRVLRDFLPTCTLDEQATLYGPIQAFFLEDETPGILLRFERGGDPPEPEEIELAKRESAPAARSRA
jgi:hypothetical protein